MGACARQVATRRWRVTCTLACALALQLAAFSSACAVEPAPLRILFVGNSYLYTNDLPARVRQLAKQRGVVLETELRASPNYALSDHLRDRGFVSALAQPWDWIVLQQGPSSLPASGEDLVASVTAIAARLRGTSTRIALLAAWPAAGRAATSQAGEANYRQAAEAVDACVLPVAAAWRLAGDTEGMPVLYQIDQLHPNRSGTRLSAMIVARGLLGPDARDPGETAMVQTVDAAYAQEPLACPAR